MALKPQPRANSLVEVSARRTAAGASDKTAIRIFFDMREEGGKTAPKKASLALRILLEDKSWCQKSPTRFF